LLTTKLLPDMGVGATRVKERGIYRGLRRGLFRKKKKINILTMEIGEVKGQKKGLGRGKKKD